MKKYTIIVLVGNFSIPYYVIDRMIRQKIYKAMENLNNSDETGNQ